MSGQFTGKVAIVTGGTKGIGLATAKRFAKDGASVVVNYGSDAAAAEEALKELGGDRALAVQADAGSVAGAEKIVKAAVDKFGRVDIVVPNAGTSPMMDLESTTEEAFDKAYALNVKGPYFLCQKAVPHMPEGGRVVLISTGVVKNSNPQPQYLLYGSTKGAIEAFGRNLAKDLGRKKINVNVVAPGPTATALFMRGKTQETVDMLANLSPFSRLGAPEDIADVIVFLAGHDSRWMSGQIVGVNGAVFV